jgi:peptidoglycan/xylan/chitin deacetylase (PgdA/CDA1 family)
MLTDIAIRGLSGPLARKIFRRAMSNRACIFALHRQQDEATGIHGVSVSYLRKALEALKLSGAKFVPLKWMINEWVAGRTVDSDSIAFTMDDGFADQAELVKSVFVPLQCPVTVFLISGFLDRKLWPWDDQLSYAFRRCRATNRSVTLAAKTFNLQLDTENARRASLLRVRNHLKTIPGGHLYEAVAEVANLLEVQLPTEPPPEYRPMTWQDARALEALGADFAPHSVSHRIFSHLPPQDARQEIAESWLRLRQELRDPPSILAWPTGRLADFSPRDMLLAREMGLQAAVATNDDYAHIISKDPLTLYQIRRFHLPNDIRAVLRYGSWLERGRQLLPI